MSSAGSSKDAPKASGELAKGVLMASARNTQQILADMGRDLALQSLVMQWIADYKKQTTEAAAAGLSISGMVKSTLDARKRKKDHSDDEGGVDGKKNKSTVARERVEPDASCELRRGQLVFSNWTQSLPRECLLYCDLDIDIQIVRKMSPDALKQCMERSLDIKIFGDEKDRVGSKNKKELFRSLAAVYEKLGKRLQDMEVDMSTGEVNWDSCSPLKLGAFDAEEKKLPITYQESANARPILQYLADDVLNGDTGPFTLQQHWSLTCPVVHSPTGDYDIKALFAKIARRKLGRRLSDEMGATHGERVSAQDAEKMAKQKACKKKATSLGIRKMVKGEAQNSSGGVGGSATAAEETASPAASASAVQPAAGAAPSAPAAAA
ncbi:unnamed protein product [Prorocentrum cordatum]|uniref:Uncharacterized protein n=1 Tax=Prorocentrum cordatum TaxID=2364126 RepID=A0ABN9VUE7_9DINO|nr:unnamed protein product [Polarella glacialis]